MMDSQKETRTRDFGFRGCGGVLLLDRWGAQSTYVVRGCFGPPGTEAGKVWRFPARRRRSLGYNTTQHSRQAGRQVLRECARRSNEAAMRSLARACSRSNWPQVPRTRGTDGAAQVAAARRSAGEHRTATVLDYRLRLYTEVSTLCCRVTRAIWGETFEKQGLAEGEILCKRSVWSGSARPPLAIWGQPR